MASARPVAIVRNLESGGDVDTPVFKKLLRADLMAWRSCLTRSEAAVAATVFLVFLAGAFCIFQAVSQTVEFGQILKQPRSLSDVRTLNPLKSGIQGSIVLVTTRSSKVAELVGTQDLIELRGLPSDVYWEFFKQCAFGNLNSSSLSELEDIGMRIAVRLDRSPLAAKTLGGILRANMTTRQWRNIMNSELWQIEQADGDILPALQVSYQYDPLVAIRVAHSFQIQGLISTQHCIRERHRLGLNRQYLWHQVLNLMFIVQGSSQPSQNVVTTNGGTAGDGTENVDK